MNGYRLGADATPAPTSQLRELGSVLAAATAAALPVLVAAVLVPAAAAATFATFVLVPVLVTVATATFAFVLMAMAFVVMMLAVGVDMPVADLILAGGASAEHFDVEDQILPGERMIAVEEHLVALDGRDCHDRGMAVAVGLEHVADVDLLHRQLAARHAAHQRVVAISIRLLGGNHDHPLGTYRQSGERLFQTVDDLPHALEILDWLAADGGVEELSLMVAQRVVEGDDGAGHAL